MQCVNAAHVLQRQWHVVYSNTACDIPARPAADVVTHSDSVRKHIDNKLLFGKKLLPTMCMSLPNFSHIFPLCSRQPRSVRRAEALMQQRMQKQLQLLRHGLRISQQSHTRRRIQGHTLRINLPRTQCALRLYRWVHHCQSLCSCCCCKRASSSS